MSDAASAAAKSSVRPVPVAIYTRVSTTDQVGGRFDSCASQEQLGREHIQKNAHKGYFLSGVFTDPAYSGGSLNRPGIQALMRFIEAGRAEVVLIFKFERVLRSTEDWTPFRAFLRKHHCRLESPVEDLADVTPMQRFHNNMRANLAEYERDNTSEKVKVKMLEQAKRGIWNAGQIPYGYDYDKETQTLHPHPTESKIVRRIYESAAQLVSLTEIANTLNAEGHRTKPRVFQRRDGTRENVGAKPFRSDHLRKILRNPIYVGRVRLHQEEFSAKHEPLVPRDLWERANAAVSRSSGPPSVRMQDRDKHVHLLKGLIFCGCCKRAMIPNFGGKRDKEGQPYRYYTCGAQHREGTDAGCPIQHVPAGILEDAVIGLMGAVGRREEIVQHTLAGAKAYAPGSRSELRARVAEVDQALTKLNRRLSNCIEAIAVGGTEIIANELREKVGTLKAQKEQLLVERELLRQELASQELGDLDGRRLAEALTRFQDLVRQLPVEQQKELIALCVDRIELRGKSRERTDPGTGRLVEVRLRLHAAQLVAGMEERVVVRLREARLSPITKRVMVLNTRMTLGGPRVGTKLVSPFQETLAGPITPSAPATAPSVRHPIHRARKWQRKLTANPQLSHAALARREAVSEPTVSRTLKMLQLLPDIQEMLLQLKRQEDIQRFSLTKMVAVAALPPAQQKQAFARMSQ